MKKMYLSLLALLLPYSLLQARPIDQQTAQRLAQGFVTSNFEFTRQSNDLTLVKIGISNRGEACYYVFNLGSTGFVIMAADDCVRPIIGYSDEGVFNPDDMAPALDDYLDKQCLGIAAEAQKGGGNAEVSADWAMLEQHGRLVSRHGGREDVYIVETKWNQNYPYNYFCPEGEGGPGGHCYAGCVATAAAQLMKYWNHPLHGQGSYTYTPEDHPEYGPLTANFGATTYDWDNMPAQISSSSPQEKIDAVATLIYHAGVSVDMNYRPTSSGAVTGQLCNRMPQYFFYTTAMDNLFRENYTHEAYMQLVMDAIDMSWPMVHRGGGHAYVLDGYNDNDMVHFNWGWSGSSDGWFNIDDHGYTDGESVIYNYVPAAIYSATAKAPTNLSVVPDEGNALSATVSWKNPVLNLGNTALTTIDQIVVERNGQVVFSQDSVAPGAEMSFVDETIPFYDVYKYGVYAVIDGQRGKSVVDDGVYIGPTCEWNIIMQSSAFQGWNGGYVSLYSAMGKEMGRYTMTNSVPASADIQVPLGRVSFGWTAPQSNINNISITIKDSEGNTVFTYSGNSNGMAPGIFWADNNGCGNEPVSEVPYGLHSQQEENQVVLIWNYDGDQPEYGFNIYRDEQLYGFSSTLSFVDTDLAQGHCYTVAALTAGGESDLSNETCASAGDCLSATNFTYEYTGNNYKIKLLWSKPDPADGLSGYYLFRKDGQNGTYERIKLLGANSTSYTDNSANVEGDYYYRLYAYYSATDCTSSPASVLYFPNLFYLHVYYSPTGVEENETPSVDLFPNPANHSLTVDADGLSHIKVCNLLGQVVFDRDVDVNSLVINTSDWTEGIYMVMLQSEQGVATRCVSIRH